MSSGRGSVARDGLTPAKVVQALQNEGIDLNERYLNTVLHYLQGDTKTLACEKAGLPPTKAWVVFNSPKVQAALEVVIERFLVVEAAPAALRCLHMIVQDEKAAPGVRVTAANSILDRAGFDSKRLSKATGGDGKDASTMTADELRAEIARLEREQESRMKDVTKADSEPDSEPDTSQLVDIFE